MRKMAIALALVAGMAGGAAAQTTASASANVLVNVYAALSLTATDNQVDFGTVNPGAGALAVSPIASGADAAAFTATGQPSTPITITFPASVNLSNGATNIAFTPSMSAGATSTQGSSAPIASGDALTLNASGNGYLWMGGSLTVAAAQATGQYTGSVTVSIAY